MKGCVYMRKNYAIYIFPFLAASFIINGICTGSYIGAKIDKGEFIMEANTVGIIIGASVSAALAIVSFIIMIVQNIHFHKKDVEDFARVREKVDDESNYLSEKCNNLHSEHKELSKECKEINKGLSKVHNFIAKEEGVKEFLMKEMPSQNYIVNEIKAMYEKIAKLSEDNAEIRKENEILKNRNKELRQELNNKKNNIIKNAIKRENISWDIER